MFGNQYELTMLFLPDLSSRRLSCVTAWGAANKAAFLSSGYLERIFLAALLPAGIPFDGTAVI